MAHSSAPSEATQEADYRIVLDALAGRPLVVRTLDVGGDKPLPYLPIAEEENPFFRIERYSFNAKTARAVASTTYCSA